MLYEVKQVEQRNDPLFVPLAYGINSHVWPLMSAGFSLGNIGESSSKCFGYVFSRRITEKVQLISDSDSRFVCFSEKSWASDRHRDLKTRDDCA